MTDQIEQYMKKWKMLQEGDSFVVGVSGGADSVCLLFVLLDLRERYRLDLQVVHVNHGIRGADADADEDYVRHLCQMYQLPLHLYRENIESLAKKWKQSLEEAGREYRRQVFEKISDQLGGAKIALAHHMNDSAETMLLHLARGTGLAGLGGIRPVNGRYIRPLLCVTRREIETFLADRRISCCTDLTNAEDDYARNRIRHHVIPHMEQMINAQTVRHMSDTMEYLQTVQDYLQTQTDGWKKEALQEIANGSLILQTVWDQMPQPLRPMLIRDLLIRCAGRARDIESSHIQMVQELFSKQVGRSLDLPYKLTAKRTYEGVLIGRRKRNERKLSALPLCFEESRKENDWGEYHISCRIIKKADWDEKRLENSGTKYFDYDIISDTLCVRSREPGDFIRLSENGGTQKIKSFFINAKIEQDLRDEIPLLADGSRIIWIIGYRTDPFYRVREHTTRILEIQIEKGEETWQRM